MGQGKRNFIVRNPKRTDLGGLAEGFYDRYREILVNPSLGVGLYKKKPSMAKEKRWFTGLLKQIRSGDSFASVAEVDGKVVGMCDIILPKPTTDQLHIGHLGISIRDGYRSKGIGTALLRDVISKARKRYKIVTLEVFGTNKQAIHIYKKMGFKVYGNLPGGVARGKLHTNRIFMYLKV